MRSALLLVVAYLALIAQEPTPRHDKWAADAEAYCWNEHTSGTQGAKRARDPHAHRCDCHLVCKIGENNDVIGDQEDNTCELYCTRDHCHCHVESPCEMPK